MEYLLKCCYKFGFFGVWFNSWVVLEGDFVILLLLFRVERILEINEGFEELGGFRYKLVFFWYMCDRKLKVGVGRIGIFYRFVDDWI